MWAINWPAVGRNDIVKAACVPRRTQRGVAFLLFIVFAMITVGSIAGLTVNLLARQTDQATQIRLTLMRARELVIAQLTQPQLQGVATRLGQLTLLPDLPIAAGAGVDAVEPAYDGLAETTGCAYRGWSSGQNLRAPATSGARARCFGRLAWQSLGLTINGVSGDDRDGIAPWIVMSANLAASALCLPDLNPLMLAQDYSGYACPGALPYPWLTVVDERGNTISDRVAFALIAPGPPLPGQNRTATAGPRAWLDTARVSATCAAPCRPGTYNNANYNHPDNTAWTLIQASQLSGQLQGAALYDTPHRFNDTLVFVTADELFNEIEQRARREVIAALNRFQSTQGYLPFAAPLNDSSTTCQAGLTFGHPATAEGGCGAGSTPNLPAWLVDAGWARYLIYAVSPRCNQGNPACNAPGLVLDARTDINGLLITPGPAIRQAPYASAAGFAQRPVTGTGLSANPADWLDTAENAGGSPGVYVSYAMGIGPRNDHLFPIE